MVATVLRANPLAFLLAALCAVTAANPTAAQTLGLGRLAVTTRDSGVNLLSATRLRAPWRIEVGLGEHRGEARLRQFGDRLFATETGSATLVIYDLPTFTVFRTITFAAKVRPIDTLLLDANTALVTDGARGVLLLVDIATGTVGDSLDLTSLADADRNPDLAMMEMIDGHIYVQVQRLSGTVEPPHSDAPLLAVLQVDAEMPERVVLLDTIGLQGDRPFFRMFANSTKERLWVSACGNIGDFGSEQRGIEEVDLVRRRSLGFIATEGSADVSAFVRVDDDTGYLVAHTNFPISTHLWRFRRGAAPEEIDMSANGPLMSIAYDPLTARVFYPYSAAGRAGVVAFEAATATQIAPLLEVGGTPFDLLVIR